MAVEANSQRGMCPVEAFKESRLRIAKNKHHFALEQETQQFLAEMDAQMGTETIMPSEEDLLKLVTEYFARSEAFAHRRHVLAHIRNVYGNRPFGKCGYGTFAQFLERHGLDMGIAKREHRERREDARNALVEESHNKEDFRSIREWKQWKGCKM